jgi:hypothetical protein
MQRTKLKLLAVSGVENNKQALRTVEGGYFLGLFLDSRGWSGQILCS